MIDRIDIVLRANILGGMNDYILNVVGDEDTFDIWWTDGVPDECDENELMEIAEDEEEFNRICYLFGNLINGFHEQFVYLS